LAWNRNSNECKSNLRVNKGEDRHKLARAVFHGKQGELRQRYREGQEDQRGALGLVVNLYIKAALEQLAREGHHNQKM
jgi:TnpA family transposase